MIGVVRPLARYAVPMSWMKPVGECVWRVRSGLSLPRGETAPPITVTVGATALIASYVFASRLSYAGAAASLPSALNCGSQ